MHGQLPCRHRFRKPLRHRSIKSLCPGWHLIFQIPVHRYRPAYSGSRTQCFRRWNLHFSYILQEIPLLFLLRRHPAYKKDFPWSHCGQSRPDLRWCHRSILCKLKSWCRADQESCRRLHRLQRVRSSHGRKNVLRRGNHGNHISDQRSDRHVPGGNRKRSHCSLWNADSDCVPAWKSAFRLSFLQKHRRGSQPHHPLFAESCNDSVPVSCGLKIFGYRPRKAKDRQGIRPQRHRRRHREIRPM